MSAPAGYTHKLHSQTTFGPSKQEGVVYKTVCIKSKKKKKKNRTHCTQKRKHTKAPEPNTICCLPQYSPSQTPALNMHTRELHTGRVEPTCKRVAHQQAQKRERICHPCCVVVECGDVECNGAEKRIIIILIQSEV